MAMIELSEADRAAIEDIIGPRENKSLRDVLRDSLEHGVEYGIRAGLERAAKMCDMRHAKYGLAGASADAAAIRALLDKD